MSELIRLVATFGNWIIARMNLLTYIIIYLLLGSFTGVLAGLFGVGGGTIIVPALIATLALQHVSPEVSTHIAIGTSLATISMTSLSSIRAHHLRGAVDWQIFWQLMPGICLGVWFGAAIASHLSGLVLQKCFAIFLLLISAHMLSGSRSPNSVPEARPGDTRPSGMQAGIAGVLIGFLSAWFGIGGGSLSVPFLHWRGVTMQRAVATAAAAGFPLAVTGAFSYGWQGWDNALLPAGSTGFVYWPAFAGIVATSIWFAQLGAQMAHAINADKLKRFFAIFLLVIGFYFLIR